MNASVTRLRGCWSRLELFPSIPPSSVEPGSNGAVLASKNESIAANRAGCMHGPDPTISHPSGLHGIGPRGATVLVLVRSLVCR